MAVAPRPAVPGTAGFNAQVADAVYDPSAAPAWDTSAAKLTKGTTPLVGVRGLWCGTAGTANFVTAAGTVVTNFPLLQGLNPIQITQLNTGGTCDDVWPLY